jgi:PAS domain S-box-containing protein
MLPCHDHPPFGSSRTYALDHSKGGRSIKRAEFDLRKANERLLAVQRMARIADWEELDPENLPAVWSSTAESLFGASPPTTEQALFEILHPDDHVTVKAAYQESFRRSLTQPHETHLTHECRVQHPEKGWVWMRETIHHRRDSQGRLVSSHGTVQDINDLKLAQDELGRREAILGAVSRAAARFLAAKSWRDEIGGLLADIGQGTGAARISIFRIACDAQRALASHVAEWAPPGVPSLAEHDILCEHDMRAMGLGRWVDAHERGEAIVGAVRDMPEGERPILELQGIISTATVPILVEGRLWGNIGIDYFTEEHAASSAEIAGLSTAAALLAAAIEREALEVRLQSARAWLQALFEHAPFGISIKDLDGRYLMVNPMSKAMIGVPPEALVGRTVDEVFPHAAPQVRRQEHEVLTTGRAVRHYFAGESSEPASSQLVVKFPIRGADDAIVALGTIALDMTEQRRLEQRLVDMERLRAIGQLTGGVAHDFNNMLASILGNIELAEEKIDPASPIRRYLETARRATERSAKLTYRLLAFARRQPLAPRVVDVKAHIAGVADLIARPLGPSIAVDLRLDAATWPALVDASQLENALVNLALNARDAMPGGGTLTVATGNVTFDAATAAREAELRPGDYVEIAVADDGVGMAPDVLAHAFEPFFTTKETGKGTGLGLSMVFGFAKQSNGHVRIESMVGRGTTVRLFLPRAHDPVPHADDDVSRPPMGSGQVVLVVEDDSDVRGSVAAMLERLGYRTRQAEDGATALDLVRAGEPIDVVLTDVVMPGGMTGRVLADLLAGLRPALPVIVMSGFAADAFDGRTDGIAGARFLAKPFTKEALARAVHLALEGVEP